MAPGLWLRTEQCSQLGGHGHRMGAARGVLGGCCVPPIRLPPCPSELIRITNTLTLAGKTELFFLFLSPPSIPVAVAKASGAAGW